MALLACYGLISLLILWRAFVLDKSNVARFAATQPPASTDPYAPWSLKASLVYICCDFTFWIVIASGAGGRSVFLGLAVIVLWGLLAVLCVKLHTRAEASASSSA